MAAVTEPFEGEIVPAESSPTPVDTRAQLIEQCGQHQWRLHLNPETPDWVEVYCHRCPASLNDIWDGAIDNVYINLNEYRVSGGQHTATQVVDRRIDVMVRESKVMNKQSLDFYTELEVQVQFADVGIAAAESEVPEGTGTGWCAPSP